MQFGEWIDQEINKRGWSRREASRRADVSQSMLNKVITGEAQAGLTVFRGLAKAFDVSLVEILIQAGEVDPRDLTDEGLNEHFSRLTPRQQRMVIRFIESITQDDASDQNPSIFTQTSQPKPKPAA